MGFSTADWWNSAYTYRRVISITAPGGEAVPAGYSVELTEDTAALVTAGKVLASRNDWRIVYWSGGVNTELSRHYVSAASTFFKIQAEIAAGDTDSNYFVYYKNDAATAPTVTFSSIYHWGDDFEDGGITDWSKSLGSGCTLVASTSSPLIGSYSMLHSGTSISYAWYDFAATVTNAVYKVQIRLNITDTYGFDFNVHTGTTLLYYQDWSTGHVVTAIGSGSSNTLLNPFVHGTAYTATIDVDPATDTADSSAGGSSLADKALVTSCGSISRIKFVLRGTVRIDDVIVRRLMATAPTVTQTDEAQLVTQTKTIVYDVGTTTEITQTKTVVYDVWAATITQTKTVVFDLLNQVTQTKTVVYDLLVWNWEGPIHGVYMTPSIHAVKMPDSIHAVYMTPSTHTVAMCRRT